MHLSRPLAADNPGLYLSARDHWPRLPLRPAALFLVTVVLQLGLLAMLDRAGFDGLREFPPILGGP